MIMLCCCFCCGCQVLQLLIDGEQIVGNIITGGCQVVDLAIGDGSSEGAGAGGGVSRLADADTAAGALLSVIAAIKVTRVI